MVSESNQPTGNADYIVVYNKDCGREKKHDLKKEVIDFFSAQKLNYKIFYFEKSRLGELKEMIANTINPRLVVVGGDGTLRVIFEYNYFNNIDVPVAFVPKGSANISAHYLGLPRNIKQALQKAIDGIPKLFDLGMINNHIFFIAAVLGKIAEISIEPTRNEKRRLGIFAYFKKINRLFKGYNKYPFALDELDNEKEKIKIDGVHTVVICNQMKFYKLKLASFVRADDGILNLFMMTSNSFFGVIKTAYQICVFKKDTKILKHQPIKDVIISGQDFDGKIHLDGDVIVDNTNEYKIKVLPGKAKIII